MNDDKKTCINKVESSHILILAGVLFICVITRTANIGGLPLFTDEAVYIRWAQIIRSDLANILLPLKLTKQPLYIWLNVGTISFFEDPLVSARIISVVAGLFTSLGLFLVGSTLYSPVVGLLSSLLYTLVPFTVFHDRLAIADSLLSMFSIYTLLLGVLIMKKDCFSWKGLSIYLGLVMACGFLTKSPALGYILVLPLTLFLLQPAADWRQLCYPLVVSYFIAFLIVGSVNWNITTTKGTSPIFHEAKFYLSFPELFSFPYQQWSENIRTITDYLYRYLTPLLFFSIILSIVKGLWSGDKRVMALFLWFLFPVAVIIFIGKIFFSRYILFCILPLLITTADFLVVVKDKIRDALRNDLSYSLAIGALFMLLLLPCVVSDYYIISNPIKADLVEQDRFQYVSGWPSGYGTVEAVNFLKEKARQTPITVFTTTIWGNPADAVMIYLKDNPNIKVYEAWWWNEAPIVPDNVATAEIGKSKYLKGIGGKIEFKALKEVYFVTDSFRHPMKALIYNNPDFIRSASFVKPGGDTSVDVYKLNR